MNGRDESLETLRAKFKPKLEAIQEKMRRAQEKLARQQAQASQTGWDATIAVGSSVLGAILGRKTDQQDQRGRLTSAAKAATRAAKQREDASQAAAEVESLRKQHDDLFAEFQQKIESMAAAMRPEALMVEVQPIRPRKTDITVEKVVLAWMPYQVAGEGRVDAAY